MRLPEHNSLRTITPAIVLAALLAGFAVGSLGAQAEADHLSSTTDPVSSAPDPGVWSIELGGFTRLDDAVAFAEDEIWAVGDGIVHYDGSEWTQVAGFEHPEFHAIDGFSSNELWAVGEVSSIGCDRSGFVMRRDADGWRTEPVETHQPLFDVAMISPTEGWAVGGVEVPVILHYDGTRWRETGAPETGGLRAVHMIDDGAGWAVGDRGAIVRYDGTNWMAVRSPTWATLLDVHMLDEHVGWAVGIGDYSRSGIILAFENGEWFVDTENRTPVLGAVHTLGPSTALAVGMHGVLMYFDGDEWREIGRTYPGGFEPYVGDEADPEGLEPVPDGLERVVVQATGKPSRLADATARQYRVLGPGEAGPEAPGRDSEDALGGGPSYGPPYYDSFGSHQMLRGLCLMPDAETLLAVGDAGQVVHIDDQTWAEVHAGRLFVAIDMRTASDGWMVGPDGSPLHWDGDEWRAHQVPRRARYLQDVATVAADDAWAVGDNGSVVHWDGSRWTLWPSFTSVDLTAVSFSAADDGWVVANIYDQLMDTRESRVFHWDGSGWDQAFRLCHQYLYDVAAASPSDVWFAAGGMELLHFDGAAWAWHPVLGLEHAGGRGARVLRITLTPDGGWGTGRGVARYDGQVWRTLDYATYYWDSYQALAAIDTLSYWAIDQYSRYESGYVSGGYDSGGYEDGYGVYHLGETGELAVAHEGPVDLASIDAILDEDGVLHVWAVGGASTVLHYQASGPDVPLPEPTATPRLPAPELRPSPTPRSSLRADDVRDMILSRYDPEGERRLAVTRIELRTVSEVGALLDDFSDDAYWGLSWSWRSSYGESCYSWRPIWFAVVEGDVWCGYSGSPTGSHAVMILDGATGREESTRCLAEIRSRLHFPLAVGGGYTMETDYPTPTPRNVTPRPAESIDGPCPTMTPYPIKPPSGYPEYP